ncbi:carbamoyltransferase HypF [Plantactinospora endophytica]|uniref:carbamoyltransferase HypF n=1 Tax=Plantactinospora endophytica TaxID=673535 RepID=UPI0019405209|nr:carbamoyltransferase HypF [Plantactinospora endophytica]
MEGTVQGVGFRPFVYALATEFGLSGLVGNDPGGVFIEVEGAAPAVTALVDAVRDRAPALAEVDRVDVTRIPVTGSRTFEIAPSRPTGSRSTTVAPDAATCADCLAELFDPADRRHRYPFVNCTNCGPRYTIVTDLPYDRPGTTMAGFAMCPDCAREYHDPGDRRFHAQPVCCPACGPTLELVGADGTPVPGDPVRTAAAWLDQGAVVAVKGLGGYHLAVDATDEEAVATLRARKRRPGKAFAVLARDLTEAARLGVLDEVSARLLDGARRPVVLLPRRAGAPVAPSVAPGDRLLGVLLPYTPLHHLLAGALDRPLVLTSANVSDEPIVHRDDDAGRRLPGLADAVLRHDRPIHAPCDDSVVRVVRGRPTSVRRARGYAPEPIVLPWPSPRPVLGCGGQTKNTFCLADGRRAILSPHVGDLDSYPGTVAFADGVARLCRLFGVTPAVVAHDLHPDYPSTRYARALPDVELVAVQHHHAHVAACLAENGEPGPVVGVAFDGTGYGTDGTVWGGELLVADLTGFVRAGHLLPVPMPGGTAAIRQPWRMAAAYLSAAYDGQVPDGLDVVRRNADRWPDVLRLAARGVNSPPTSSAGRLFDAVAALLGVRDVVDYEGQAAVELEQLADPGVRDGYPVTVTGPPTVDPPGGGVHGVSAPVVGVHGVDLVRGVLADLRRGVQPAVIAARFHHGLAAATVTAVRRIAETAGLGTVALSGGVFGNPLLLGAVTDGLTRHGLRVLTHHRVPCNDGGISLGQVAVAAALDRVAAARSGAGEPGSADPGQRVADEQVHDPGTADSRA